MRDRSFRSAHARPVGGRPDCPPARCGRGFTLIEAMVATAVIGMGVAAILVSAGSGTRVNRAGQQITQATFLAQELREWTLRLPFVDPDTPEAPPGPDGTSPQTFVDDLNDLMNVVYTPPRDGQGFALADMSGWSERIEMSWRDPDDLNLAVIPGNSNIVYVEVYISYRDQEMLHTGWFATRK